MRSSTHGPPKLKGTKTQNKKRVVQWDNDETEFLALEIHKLRRENPGAQIVHLLNKAQKALPSNRRRNITTVNQFEPVLRRLKEIDNQIWIDHEHMIRYREKVEEQKNAPTRTEVFSSVTDEELSEFFQERVLDNIEPTQIIERIGTEAALEMLPFPRVAAFAAMKQMECFNRINDVEALMWDIYARFEEQNNKQSKPISRQAQERNNNGFAKKPKVVFYGLLPKQQQEIMARLGKKVRYHFVDKKREQNVVPSEADIIIFWARYCSHGVQKQVERNMPNECQFILHHGGIGEMVAKVNNALSSCHT